MPDQRPGTTDHEPRTKNQGIGESLRTLFNAGTLSGATDGQLLVRFAGGGGGRLDAEAAFSALVERHGPMVPGVCRSVLGDRHDAEDACQATFLVLAQRAGSIRRSESVASWLYGVARRVALRARRRAARRRDLENRRRARVVVAEAMADPPAEPWPELYEELDRLPEPFRTALVLCDLEGHSYEQAAAILRCPVGTVQSRLARGRERLRGRLERRGLAPAIVAAGAGGSSGAPLSPQLVKSIVRTAVTAITNPGIAGAAYALARAEVRRRIMTRFLTGLTALVLTGLIAATTIGLALAGRREERLTRRHAAGASQKALDGLIHVRVEDDHGAGAGGIAVEVRSWNHPRRSVPTDAGGRGVIPREVISDGTMLFARRGARFLGWAQVRDRSPDQPAGTEDDPIVMKLIPLTHRVEGSVTDPRGKPISGAAIEVQSLPNSTGGGMHLLRYGPDRMLDPAVTDNTGHFVMMLPEGVNAGLRAAHPRYFGPGTSAKPDSRVLDPLVLELGGAIVGTVTAATGQPVEGTRLGAQLLEHRVRILGGYGHAVSDKEGRFLIGGLEPGVYNLLFSTLQGHEQLTARAVEGLRVRAGADTPVNMTVIRGRPLRGVVVDRATNQPLAGVMVGCYGPAHPRSGAAVETRTTDDQGRFTFHIPPGEQVVYIMDGRSIGRLSRRDLIVSEHAEIEAARLMGSTDDAHWPMAAGFMKADVRRPPAKARVKDVMKVATKGMTKEHLVRDPARVTALEKAEGPAEKGEGRTITGHVRDPDGQPLVGVSVYVNVRPQINAPFQRFNSAVTDRDGLFLLADLSRRPLQINLNHPGFMIQTENLPPDRDRVEFTYRLEPDPRDRDRAAHDEPIPPGLRDRLTFVDLDGPGNDFLADGPGRSGNDLNYADGTSEHIPLVYGRNIVNWWKFLMADDPTEAETCWVGCNDATGDNAPIKIRLYAITWANPHPEKAIGSLDVISAGKGAEPFLVAVTLSRREETGR